MFIENNELLQLTFYMENNIEQKKKKNLITLD